MATRRRAVPRVVAVVREVPAAGAVPAGVDPAVRVAAVVVPAAPADVLAAVGPVDRAAAVGASATVRSVRRS